MQDGVVHRAPGNNAICWGAGVENGAASGRPFLTGPVEVVGQALPRCSRSSLSYNTVRIYLFSA